MKPRRLTRTIYVKDIPIGSAHPIVIQSMTKTKTSDIAATLNQIGELTQAGCEIVRVAVPDQDAADALKKITQASPIPVIADIHFNKTLALAVLSGDSEIAGLRLNPGNIDSEGIHEIIKKVAEKNLCLRVGVNSGSISKRWLEYHQGLRIPALVDSVMEFVKVLENEGVQNIKISAKCTDISETIQIHKILAERLDYPFHIGMTEAGLGRAGTIRSAIGIGILLYEGFGDTLRVSLTENPVCEVEAAWSILSALGLRQRGPVMFSCPQCGRADIDILNLAPQLYEILERKTNQGEFKSQKKDSSDTFPITVALMGCEVNGPGEAAHADVGIAGGKDCGILFSKGKKLKKVSQDQIITSLIEEVQKLYS